MKRRLMDVVVPLVIFIVPLAAIPERLLHPAPWLGFFATMLILWTQPSLSPKDMVTPGPADRKSALGIFLGMIVPLLTAVLHYGYRQQWQPPPLSPATILGAALVVGGLSLRLVAICTLGRYFTATVQVQEGQTVVQTGPYRLLRHPSYTGALMVAGGVTVALGSWLGLVLIATIAVPAYLHRIAAEEKTLSNEFGEPYSEYCRKTRRLIPFLY